MFGMSGWQEKQSTLSKRCSSSRWMGSHLFLQTFKASQRGRYCPFSYWLHFDVSSFIFKAFTNSTITGWSSLIVIQLFFSGIILFMLGMIGEYIGRIYDEAKDRPLYIVRDSYGLQAKPHPVQSPVHFKQYKQH